MIHLMILIVLEIVVMLQYVLMLMLFGSFDSVMIHNMQIKLHHVPFYVMHVFPPLNMILQVIHSLRLTSFNFAQKKTVAKIYLKTVLSYVESVITSVAYSSTRLYSV